MSDCITYYTSITQSDIPVRQLNKYNYDPKNPNNPCNSYICSATAKEYECMGIDFTPILDENQNVTGYTSSYKSLENWAQQWEDGYCLNLFQDMVTGLGTNQSNVAFSSSNFIKVQEDFNFMFSRYFNNDPSTQYSGNTGPTGSLNNPCLTGNEDLPTHGCTGSNDTWCQNKGKFSNAGNNCNVWINNKNALTIPGKQGYNGFLDVLLDACYNIPGACAQTQDYMCRSCNREQIYANPTLVKFCGCSSSADSGDTFYNSDLQNFDSVCDPLCNRIDTIKYNNPTTGSTLQCNANVCVIDAVQINSISSAGITPSFNQVCPACADGNGNCICIIDATFNTTIPSIKGENGEGALNSQPKFNQYCPNSQCYEVDPYTNQYVPVPCSNNLPKGNEPTVEIPWKFAFICLIIFIVALLVIFAYKYQSDNIPIYNLSQKYYRY
jgi:hypothetical protein